MYSLTATVGNYARLYQKLHKTIQPYVFLAAELNGAIGIMASKKNCHKEKIDYIHRVRTALSNQNSRTFQGQVIIFQGLKITEVQGSAILTHIFSLHKTHVTAQETATPSTETALGRPPHIILRFINKAALLGKIVK